MKTSKLFIYLTLLLFLAPAVTSCSDDDDMDIPGHTIPPKAVLSSDKTSFEALTGAAFVLEATVTQGYNVQHEWKIGDMVIGQEARLEYAFADPGTFEVVYSALNGYGADRHPFTVEVSQGANPGITFSTDKHGHPFVAGRQQGGLDLGAAGLLRGDGGHETHQAHADLRRGYDLHHAVHADGRQERLRQLVQVARGQGLRHLPEERPDEGRGRRREQSCGALQRRDVGRQRETDVPQGYYFGYGPVPALEYYNFYNVATHSVLQWTGNAWPNNPVDPVTGAMGADPWDAWFMDVNSSGDVRFVHFFALWDSHPNPSPDLMSSCLTVTENGTKIGVYSFYCCGADGRPDFVNYQALGDKYFEFKMIAVEDMPQP